MTENTEIIIEQPPPKEEIFVEPPPKPTPSPSEPGKVENHIWEETPFLEPIPHQLPKEEPQTLPPVKDEP